MKQALLTMLELQHRMNTRVHEDWINQNFEWYRAAWIECGELMDHYGYKWWKQQHPDMNQVRLEIIDIWHFGMSALFTPGADVEAVADTILEQLQGYQPSAADVRAATEALAEHCLASKSFSVAHFWDLMQAADLDFQQLYTAYVGKNVLNFFRQDHGYKDGSYQKQWQGREDNEHLVDLAAELDGEQPGYSDRLYAALEQRYRECCP
ncbi:MAG: dUTP diphosphatase [Gammaproteobacteria bacterium]|nr:dUTP diphosphatase [Gammaproteobacteria bacterium]